MACFLTPMTAAIILTSAKKKIPAKYHINWLLAMLWGGVAWLIPEHIYHGEVVLYPPFFTAGFDEMLPEIIRVGVPMVLATVAVWGILAATDAFIKGGKLQPRLAGLMFAGAVIMIVVDKIM